MRFIEKTLPIEHLNPVAMAEGNAKKPVSRMHNMDVAALLEEMEEITDDVAQQSQARLELKPKVHSEVEQLALFLRESEARYGK